MDSVASAREARGSGLAWRLFIVAVSILPVLGVFTTTRMFFVRDLSFFFWSRHLWLRHTIFSGQAPWWDPNVAGGQSAIADALNQIAMPVTLLVRLLPSDIVSFNVWVALPLPIAALGMFAFLRQRVPPLGAAIGASVFALSGPVVSSLNTPNLSWSVAFIPWVFWSIERPNGTPAARLGIVAAAFALQALCGEPVTWVATGAIAAGYAIVRRRIVPLAGLAGGGLLAALQLVPTLLAGIRAHRAALATPDFWSLHPVSLWEAIAPNLFGNYYDAFLADLPWMRALNFGRDPFFYSLYVGPLVLLLAVAGVAAAPRRNLFWVAVTVAAVTFSLGGYTPIYPLVRKLVPPLMYFRFPVKYIVFAVFAMAVMAAGVFSPEDDRGPDSRHPPQRGAYAAAACALLGLLLCAAAFAMPEAVTRASYWLATSTHLKDPAAGAAFLARSGPPLGARFFALLLAGCVLLAGTSRRRYAAPLLLVAICADLAITNGGLNLTMEAAKLAPPAWYTASAGPQRIYIGGRVRGYMNSGDPDGVATWQMPAERTAIEGRMELNALLPMAPSGWRVREALSYDLPYLWPSEYEGTVRQFEGARAGERAAFLRRTGVRRCVLPQTEMRQFRKIADVSDWNMRVFECNAGASRSYVASSVAVAASPSDLAWQRDALFDVTLADDAVRLASAPRAAGTPGTPGPPSLRFVSDLANEVTLDVTLGADGVLVLRDTYDPSWRATVDGMDAGIVRANGIYRAVAVPAGRHVVRFTYRPRDFMAGLMITVVTGVALIGFAGFSRSSRGSRAAGRERGFTLIELMIVLAIISILLGIAFNQYRGMQAKGNEASAIGSLRAIATAQWQFASTCANGKYSTTLPGLGQAVPTTGHSFLSPDLTQADTFEKSGYVFQMAAKPIDGAPPACNGAAVAEGYAVTADPVRPGMSGTIFYGVNADRIIYMDEAQTFKENLGETGPAGHGAEVR